MRHGQHLPLGKSAKLCAGDVCLATTKAAAKHACVCVCEGRELCAHLFVCTPDYVHPGLRCVRACLRAAVWRGWWSRGQRGRAPVGVHAPLQGRGLSSSHHHCHHSSNKADWEGWHCI